MKSNTVIRLISYFVITVSISFISQLEALKFDIAAVKAAGVWTLAVKSLLPGLVSLKAFFDNTAVDTDTRSQVEEVSSHE